MRLHRSRDFVLFQSGQLLSAFGSSFTTVAYPLLVLSLTGSPAKAGVVSFARILAAPLLGPLAGVAADRYDRKRQMIAADGVRVVAIGGLAALVAFDPVFWPIPLLAFVEGAGRVVLPRLPGRRAPRDRPAEQLADASQVQQAQRSRGRPRGPAGGRRAVRRRALRVPFVADAVSYAFSFVSLLLVRAPFQQPREPRTLEHSRRARGGLSLHLAAAVPAGHVDLLPDRQLRDPGIRLRDGRRGRAAMD